MTEFAEDGAIVFDARLPHGGQSYRAFRFPWVGRPTDRPVLAVRAGMAYASWNGATELASWQLLQGANASNLQNGPRIQRTGFETTLTPGAQARSVAVVALDGAGVSLGKSATVDV